MVEKSLINEMSRTANRLTVNLRNDVATVELMRVAREACEREKGGSVR
jgi:hypothetical protein